MRTLEGIRKHWCLVACAYAGLTLRRASHLRGIPEVLTLHSMAMEILLEVAVNYVHVSTIANMPFAQQRIFPQFDVGAIGDGDLSLSPKARQFKTE